MDQVKEFLRQVARYRFWISVCVAALLSAGAYVMGSGPVQTQAAAEVGKITSAHKDVQQYTSPSVPTPAFKPVVEEKTAALTKDVDTAWKELYDRQAPLLTWPENVSERFKKWGRKWPEDAAASAVQLAIVDYVEAYPTYVEEIFKVFHPFNYETGEGIVASADSAGLLRPAVFDVNKPPGLGKVWSAQERLWIQRTVLEVVAQVNRNAKDWESAYLKEIKTLEVGNALSQDQRSIAKGEELEEAESIVAPGEEEVEEEAGGMGGSAMMGPGMMGPGMMGSSGMGGGAAALGEAESVLFLKPENATQYKILPIMLTVLIDQNHVQDLLVELENSPMAIEVKDIELLRPTERVVKPEKGSAFTGYGMGGMPGMMGGYGGMMSGMMGRGRMSEMGMGMMGPGGMMGSGSMMGGRMGEMGMGMMGPGGMGAGAAARKGVDKRGTDRAEKRKETEKALETTKAPALFDPYYDIVQVTVYGQARFYNEPTPEVEESLTSPGEAGAETDADEPTKVEQAEPGTAAEAANPDAAMPKTDAEETDPEAVKPEEPKADSAEAAKPEAPNAEADSADDAKPEAPKADATPAPADDAKPEDGANPES